MKDIVIIDGARTAFGTYGGALRDTSATDLGVIAAKGALEKSKVDPKQIDQVIFGNVLQTSADAPYLARHIGLRADVSERLQPVAAVFGLAREWGQLQDSRARIVARMTAAVGLVSLFLATPLSLWAWRWRISADAH